MEFLPDSGVAPTLGAAADRRALAWGRPRRVGVDRQSCRETRRRGMTATQSPTNEQPKTASDSAERRYATVNPFTGETEKEFPFTDTSKIDGIIERAPAGYQAWRNRPVQERAAVVRRAAELMDERRAELAAL